MSHRNRYQDIPPNKYREWRIQKLKTSNIKNWYPTFFPETTTISEFCKKFKNSISNGETISEIYHLRGRIFRIRTYGRKLYFIDIVQDENKIQILVNREFYEKDFNYIANILARGDIIGVKGNPHRSKTGELSILSKEIILLSPCLQPLTKEGNHFEDKEMRFRNRCHDLLVNPENLRIFKIRSRIIQYIRNFFEKKGFLEVETPMMHPIPGGASAKPFMTYHNDMQRDIFLRISPELYLKMCIISGIEKVFEIGKQFRNESADSTHNPEFTSIEAYQAGTDYQKWMDYTEELLSQIVLHLFGSHKIKFHQYGKPLFSDSEELCEKKSKTIEIDFTPPFKKLDIITELEEKLKTKIPLPLDRDFLDILAKENHVDCQEPRTATRLLDKLIGKFLEKDCVNPTFLCHHPLEMSPLAKRYRNQSELSERFELFINKKEFCNAYTELNDPFEQFDQFQRQAKDKIMGDDEAQITNENYCQAMEYGLPPTGGWGMGIDRLIMLLTDNTNIEEVLLFPLLRQ